MFKTGREHDAGHTFFASVPLRLDWLSWSNKAEAI